MPDQKPDWRSFDPKKFAENRRELDRRETQEKVASDELRRVEAQSPIDFAAYKKALRALEEKRKVTTDFIKSLLAEDE
ncbi:MAG TPA: hypothetical protein VMY05_09005 [Acidobacteriota bacterium]|nr:hypothetical protein [Acidobacteriota bacterium]